MDSRQGSEVNKSCLEEIWTAGGSSASGDLQTETSSKAQPTCPSCPSLELELGLGLELELDLGLEGELGLGLELELGLGLELELSLELGLEVGLELGLGLGLGLDSGIGLSMSWKEGSVAAILAGLGTWEVSGSTLCFFLFGFCLFV